MNPPPVCYVCGEIDGPEDRELKPYARGGGGAPGGQGAG